MDAVPYIFSSVQKLKVTCVKRWGRINAKNLDLCSRAIRSGCEVYEVERFIRCQLNRRRFPASSSAFGWVSEAEEACELVVLKNPSVQRKVWFL